MAMYKIRVNRPCRLFIDDEEIAIIEELKITKFDIPEGEYIRKVVSVDDKTIYEEKKVTLNGVSKVDDIVLENTGLEAVKRALLNEKIKIGELYYQYTLDSNLLEVTCPLENDQYKFTDIVIPSQIFYTGYLFKVTGIGDCAFKNCKALKTVTLPDTIERVGYKAFFCCSSLCKILLPNSVVHLGYKSFAKCSNLSFVSLGFGINKLDYGLFDECNSLSTLAITDNIKYIAPNTISRVNNIRLNITKIENICNGFYGQLFYDLNIGHEGNELYLNGKKITHLFIPNYITRIEDCAFYGFTELQIITIPDSVVYIGTSAFTNCFSLKYIVIPPSVNYIGNCAFYNHNLTAVILNTKSLPECGGNLFTWRYPAPIIYAYDEVLKRINEACGWNECDQKYPIIFNVDNILYEVTSHETVLAIINKSSENLTSTIIPDEITYNNTKFIVTSIKQI